MKSTNPTADEALAQVMQYIVDGATTIDASRQISKDARDLYVRRYHLTFETRLKERDWEAEKKFVFEAGERHGMLAAIIAYFDADHPKDEISDVAFMKAAHIIEIECRYFVDALKRQKRVPEPRGPWCW
jgi:hypothetical protein